MESHPAKLRGISIHALRKEGDAERQRKQHGVLAFLSTPSARRATTQQHEHAAGQQISIHALRKEGDAHRIRRWDSITQFLSTPSARRATWRLLLYMGKVCNFYPRPPRGGRLFAVEMLVRQAS